MDSSQSVYGSFAFTRSLGTVSLDLRDALEDLQDLQEALSTDSLSATAENNAHLSAMASKFFKGMRSVHVVCNTGDTLQISAHILRSLAKVTNACSQKQSTGFCACIHICYINELMNATLTL